MTEFKKGDRVWYIKGEWSPSPDNPLKGTSFECKGTVDGVCGRWIFVQWDNAEHNAYHPNQLELIEREGCQMVCKLVNSCREQCAIKAPHPIDSGCRSFVCSRRGIPKLYCVPYIKEERSQTMTEEYEPTQPITLARIKEHSPCAETFHAVYEKIASRGYWIDEGIPFSVLKEVASELSPTAREEARNWMIEMGLLRKVEKKERYFLKVDNPQVAIGEGAIDIRIVNERGENPESNFLVTLSKDGRLCVLHGISKRFEGLLTMDSSGRVKIDNI